MIELFSAIHWKLVNNKDQVISTAQISSEKLSAYIGEGSTNRILPAYPSEGKPAYPCLVINCLQNADPAFPETSRVLVQMFFYTTANTAGGQQHTQLSRFFNLVRHFLAEEYDQHNDLVLVKDDQNNLVIGGKYHVESFTLNWVGAVVYLPQSDEHQLATNWLSHITQEHGG